LISKPVPLERHLSLSLREGRALPYQILAEIV
jgi:hypothetical protein